MGSWVEVGYQKAQALIGCLEFQPRPNDGACVCDAASVKSVQNGVAGWLPGWGTHGATMKGRGAPEGHGSPTSRPTYFALLMSSTLLSLSALYHIL